MSSETEFSSYLSRRCRSLNSQPMRTRGSDYVLCWLQQVLRGDSNPVIDAALAFGTLTGKPVLVYHGLGQHYPHASDRLHQFILQASRSLEQAVTRRGIRFLRYVETDGTPANGLVYQLASRASVLVLDDQAAFVGRWQAQKVAAKLDRRVVAVDGSRLIPEAALGTHLTTTVQFRQRHTQLRERWFDEPHDLINDALPYSGELAIESTGLGASGNRQIAALIKRCDIDHSVPAVDWCPGDRQSALAHLHWAINKQIPGYSVRRNNPAYYSTTYLSPYLHFGVLWPGDIAPLVLASDASSRDQWRFFDQLLTWREYFHHCAFYEEDPADFSNLPLHAQQTLKLHANDKRDALYSLDELIHGETHDEIWNVAQHQFLLDGWMHNNLRMYWGKKLIGWIETPERAWQIARYLNDRFSLDGRDPATYGSLKWCFGAGRPTREVAVYGTVARKSDRALRARRGVRAWLVCQQQRVITRVSVPSSIDLPRKPQASGRHLSDPSYSLSD